MVSESPKSKDKLDKNSKEDSDAGMVIHFRLKEWFKDLTPDQLTKLKVYHAELMKANKGMNLIGVKTISQADAIHFADSINAMRQVYKKTGDSEVYDIGSGAGFPGMLMAILYPNTRVVMVEADTRKCEFLTHLSSQLGLSNTKVLNTQVERLGDNVITHALCRGFHSISKAILVLRKPVKKGGYVYHLKGEEWSTEVADIPTQLCSYWRPGLFAEYRLPIGEVTFAIVSTEKIAD